MLSDFGIEPFDIDKFEYAIVFARMFSQEVRRRENMKRANARKNMWKRRLEQNDHYIPRSLSPRSLSPRSLSPRTGSLTST